MTHPVENDVPNFEFDNRVEVLAKHLYLTEDATFDHMVVNWAALERTRPGEADYWRKKARTYLKVAGVHRLSILPPVVGGPQ